MPWTVNLVGGPRRVNHAAVAVYEKIYSFGGYCTGNLKFLVNLFVYLSQNSALPTLLCMCTFD